MLRTSCRHPSPSFEGRLGIPVLLTGTSLEIVSSDGTGKKTRGFYMMYVGRQPRLTNNSSHCYWRDLARGLIVKFLVTKFLRESIAWEGGCCSNW